MATAVATLLDGALKTAGIPIDGVSVKNQADRLTWVVRYAPNATKQQIADGDALVAAFDPTSPTIVAAEKVQAVQASLGAVRVFWLAWFRMTNKRDPTDDERLEWTNALIQAAKDTP